MSGEFRLCEATTRRSNTLKLWLERWEGGAQEHNRIVMRYGILQLHYGRCNCEFRSITRGEREGGEVRA